MESLGYILMYFVQVTNIKTLYQREGAKKTWEQFKPFHFYSFLILHLPPSGRTLYMGYKVHKNVAFGYILMYFVVVSFAETLLNINFQGTLPWQGLRAATKQQK